MNRLEQEIRLTELSHLTRRHFLSKCTTGLGAMWASTMLGNQLYGASQKLVKDPFLEWKKSEYKKYEAYYKDSEEVINSANDQLKELDGKKLGISEWEIF